MNDETLHQLVHGYSHGHSLLAGSTELERKDMDLIARLSDLSGTLSPELEITPYLSLYPLPSQKFFAIARTWADELAPRSGCVLTHTILVPLKVWAEDDSPIRFAGALRVSSRDALAEYAIPIRSIPNASRRCAVNEPLGNSFTQRYFGEGLTPLVWFGALDPELAAWCVIQALWPTLRARFACCTLALQPRALDERPFDLLFAPLSAYSRFSDFARDHVVDSRAPSNVGGTESQFQSWSDRIFKGSDSGLSRRVRELSFELEPHPIAIRRVLLYLELEARASNSPTAVLGALDLLETLVPQPLQALEEKNSLITTALHAIKHLNPHEALELLYLLCQRLQGSSFSSQHALQGEIRDIVQQLIKADPERGIQDADSLTARHVDAPPRSFLLGVGDALLTLLGDNSSVVSTLIEQNTLGERLIVYCPEVAAVLLRAVGSIDRERVISVLVDWCRTEQAMDVRPALRRFLLPEVTEPVDAPLIEELLRDLEPDEVPQICSVIERVEAFSLQPLPSLVARLIGERYPIEVREWSRTYPWHTYQTATLVAASYPATADGIKEIFPATTAIDINSPLLLAAFIQRFSGYSPPAWLVSLLETEPRLWEPLLIGLSNSEVIDVVLRLARSLRRSAIARVPDAERMLGDFTGKGAESVRQHALRQLLTEQLEGTCDIGKLQRWLAKSWVVETLVNASAGFLRAIVADQLRRSDTTWSRSWELIESIPAVVAFKNAALVQEVVSVLLQFRSEEWTATSAESWRQLLLKVSGGDHPQLDICSQALHFALEHARLPLGGIVAETFYPVHEAVMNDRSAQKSWSLWGFGDWDKAKDLRRSLVDSFLHSEWDPLQFALSARKPWLLKKLCKRMLRQWKGSQYLENAYTGLKKRSDTEAQELAITIRQILTNPNVPEEWD